jgi:hypothetical protein
MNDDQLQPHDDAAFERLQAADPARGTSPDLTSVYESVSAATGVPVAEETILVDELSARRARRTPMWLQAAAVVAGIAVIGGGSYALGGANAETPPTAAPAMTLDGGSRDGVGNEAAQSPASGLASGAADSKLAGWGFARTVFSSEGLSTDGGSAPAYGFDAVSAYTQETVARAAAALGVAGEPRQEYGSWVVGTNDGTGPTVSISSDGMTSVSYYDPTRDPWSCQKMSIDPVEPPADGAGTSGSAGVSEPAPTPECLTSTDPAPTGDAAVGQAKDKMSALGVDPVGFEFEVATDPSSAQYTQVSGYQVVDGQRTGVAWSFSIVATGVQSLYGSLAPTVALGDYDVVSPTEAVTRLTDPRFGPSYGGEMPLAAEARDAAGATADIAPEPTDAPTVPATPAAGSPLAWPVEHVTIVSARLGLASTTLPNGASVLVPTYELSDADGSVWTVVAVADEDLDFAA